MATLILRPTAFKSGSTSWLQSGAVVVNSGTEIADLSDNNDSTWIWAQHPDFNNTNAKTTVYTLAVSGTDIPAGRTITQYRVVARGYSSGRVVTRWVTAQVPGAEAPSTSIGYTGGSLFTWFSSWATTLNGAVPTKANLMAAGISLSRIALVLPGDAFVISDIWIEATYNDVPSVPTLVAPAAGATINVDVPVLTARTGIYGGGLPKRKMVWQFASDATFTTNLRTYTEPDSMLRGPQLPLGGSTDFSSPLPDNLKLMPGIWYYRVAAIDVYGLQGAWTSGYTLTVSHPSSANLVSPQGTGVPWNGGTLPFSWEFSDTAAPQDTQTAFQVQVYTGDNSTLLADSGKVAGGSTSAVLTLPSAYVGMGLSWRMQTWDEADQSAGWTNYLAFTPAPPPVVHLVSVTTTTPAPDFTWTYAPSVGSPLAKISVSLADQATGKVLYASGWLAVTDPSQTVFSVPQPVVNDNETVVATLYTQDAQGFIVSDTLTYTSGWALPAPPPFTVDVTQYNSEAYGYVKVTWNNSVPDPQFHSYQVWRRLNGTTAWTVIFETTVLQASYEFDDYLASANLLTDYAVVQTAIRYGANLTSAVPSAPQVVSVTPISDYYWLVDPDTPTNNLMLTHVTADEFTDNEEQEVLQIIGRGQKADYGTDYGITGSLTATIYGTPTMTARAVQMKLRALSKLGKVLYLRNPFGDALSVNMGNIGVNRLSGVGTQEFVTVTLPYNETS